MFLEYVKLVVIFLFFYSYVPYSFLFDCHMTVFFMFFRYVEFINNRYIHNKTLSDFIDHIKPDYILFIKHSKSYNFIKQYIKGLSFGASSSEGFYWNESLNPFQYASPLTIIWASLYIYAFFMLMLYWLARVKGETYKKPIDFNYWLWFIMLLFFISYYSLFFILFSKEFTGFLPQHVQLHLVFLFFFFTVFFWIYIFSFVFILDIKDDKVRKKIFHDYYIFGFIGFIFLPIFALCIVRQIYEFYIFYFAIIFTFILFFRFYKNIISPVIKEWWRDVIIGYYKRDKWIMLLLHLLIVVIIIVRLILEKKI